MPSTSPGATVTDTPPRIVAAPCALCRSRAISVPAIAIEPTSSSPELFGLSPSNSEFSAPVGLGPGDSEFSAPVGLSPGNLEFSAPVGLSPGEIRVQRSGYVTARRTLAGAPAAIEWGGRSVVTTELAPITQRSPTVTPLVITTWAPHHTLSPTRVGPLEVKPCHGTGFGGASERGGGRAPKQPLGD